MNNFDVMQEFLLQLKNKSLEYIDAQTPLITSLWKGMKGKKEGYLYPSHIILEFIDRIVLKT